MVCCPETAVPPDVPRQPDCPEGATPSGRSPGRSVGCLGSFRESVRARLSALASEDRRLLEAAAVLGRHFNWRLLGQVTGHSPDLVARALERGVGDLLHTVTAGESGFRHALTRDAVPEMTLPPRRTALPAAALAMVEAANPDRVAPGAIWLPNWL
jgi:hypothetical protein